MILFFAVGYSFRSYSCYPNPADDDHGKPAIFISLNSDCTQLRGNKHLSTKRYGYGTMGDVFWSTIWSL